MSEAKFQCPHCSRYNVQRVKGTAQLHDFMRCDNCNNIMIVEEITYFLHGRKEE